MSDLPQTLHWQWHDFRGWKCATCDDDFKAYVKIRISGRIAIKFELHDGVAVAKYRFGNGSVYDAQLWAERNFRYVRASLKDDIL